LTNKVAPWDWFLFEEDGRPYLDVLVEHGAISFSVTAQPSAEVANAFRCDGASVSGGGRIGKIAPDGVWPNKSETEIVAMEDLRRHPKPEQSGRQVCPNSDTVRATIALGSIASPAD